MSQKFDGTLGCPKSDRASCTRKKVRELVRCQGSVDKIANVQAPRFSRLLLITHRKAYGWAFSSPIAIATSKSSKSSVGHVDDTVRGRLEWVKPRDCWVKPEHSTPAITHAFTLVGRSRSYRPLASSSPPRAFRFLRRSHTPAALGA